MDLHNWRNWDCFQPAPLGFCECGRPAVTVVTVEMPKGKSASYRLCDRCLAEEQRTQKLLNRL